MHKKRAPGTLTSDLAFLLLPESPLPHLWQQLPVASSVQARHRHRHEVAFNKLPNEFLEEVKEK